MLLKAETAAENGHTQWWQMWLNDIVCNERKTKLVYSLALRYVIMEIGLSHVVCCRPNKNPFPVTEHASHRRACRLF